VPSVTTQLWALVGRPAGHAGADADLLAAYTATGDGEAFDAIVARHGPGVLRVCRMQLTREADRDDAFQATFLVFVRDAGHIRTPSALGGWLVRVAHLVCLKSRRDTARRTLDALPADPPGRSPAPPAVAEAEERNALVCEELARLPAKLRAVLVLCGLEGHTNTEAAVILGCPRGTVDSRLATAKARLKARLVRRGLGGTAAAALADALLNPGVSAALPREAARLVTATVLHPLTRSAAPTAAVLLAHGVTTTMSTLKMLAAGALAAGLIGTAGWGGLHSIGRDGPPAGKAVDAKPAEPKAAEAKAKPDLAKPADPKAALLSLTPASWEAKARNALDRGAALQNVSGLTVDAVLAQLSLQGEVVIRFDMPAIRRTAVWDEAIRELITGDRKFGETKILLQNTEGMTFADVLADIATQLSPRLTYRVRGDVILITPAHIPLTIPNRVPTPEELETSRFRREAYIEQLAGEPVSVAFNNVPIADAVATLRRLTGANIVLGGLKVQVGQPVGDGNVTATFDDVRLFTVLEIIGDMAGLQPVYTGNVYLLTTPQRAQELQKRTTRELFGDSPKPLPPLVDPKPMG